ncbi:MAG: hypothetical protein KGS45_04215 [Planctomycetes bacterium]|nr:hypothetical protein [Planctomycetota bacterium]
MSSRSINLRRGSALVAVLVIVVIGVLLAAGIMARAVSRVEDSSLSLRRSASRSMAWSGVRAAMMSLAAQRETLLMGGDAVWTDAKKWEFADPDGPGIWVVSMLPLDQEGNAALSESALINVNTATEEQLAKVNSLGSAGAAGIMGRRSRGPILAVEQVLHGSTGTPSDAASPSAPSTDVEATAVPVSTSVSGEVVGVALTALSADATLMIGDGKSERFRASELVAKDTPPEEKARQDERLGAGSGAARVWGARPAEERSLANLVADLRAANIPAQEWGAVLDGVETSEDLFVLGRIDINRAPEHVLATLPGMTTELAANLVRVRSTLDESGRRDLAWPVVSGAVEAPLFAGLVDLITTRSLQYRVRIEAGRTTRSDATATDSDEFGVASNVEAALTDRCIFEAVIDVAGEQPRIAYLRDITLLDSAAQLAGAMAATAGADESATLPEREVPLSEEMGESGASSQDAPDEPSGEIDPDASLRSNRMEGSGGLDLGGGLDRSMAQVSRQEDVDLASGQSSSSQEIESSRRSLSAPAASTVRADPRLGRWNSTTLRASERPPVSSSSPSERDGGQVQANDQPSKASRTDAAGKAPSKAPTKRVPAKNTPTRKDTNK